jgi:hypothetical protein
MLRHADASSTLADFAAPRFLNVIPDNSVKSPRRLLVCTGKIGHNLRVERERRKDTSVAIIFLEQMYPWPEEEIGIPRPPKSSGYRRSRPIWARSSTSSRTCAAWPATVPSSA